MTLDAPLCAGRCGQGLPSLHFSESSLEGQAAALEQVLEMMDRTLAAGEWSSEDVNASERPDRQSTPDPQSRDAEMELVGTEMKRHMKQFDTKCLGEGQRRGRRTLPAGRDGRAQQCVRSTHVTNGCSVLGVTSQLKLSSSARTKGKHTNTRKPRNYNIKD